MASLYILSVTSIAIKNASQEKEAEVGVMGLESWPGLKLPFSIRTGR
jgi:hypothetical protein